MAFFSESGMKGDSLRGCSTGNKGSCSLKGTLPQPAWSLGGGGYSPITGATTNVGGGSLPYFAMDKYAIPESEQFAVWAGQFCGYKSTSGQRWGLCSKWRDWCTNSFWGKPLDQARAFAAKLETMASVGNPADASKFLTEESNATKVLDNLVGGPTRPRWESRVWGTARNYVPIGDEAPGGCVSRQCGHAEFCSYRVPTFYGTGTCTNVTPGNKCGDAYPREYYDSQALALRQRIAEAHAEYEKNADLDLAQYVAQSADFKPYVFAPEDTPKEYETSAEEALAAALSGGTQQAGIGGIPMWGIAAAGVGLLGLVLVLGRRKKKGAG